MTDSVLRIALVTGASRGIGRAIALRLARDGHDIVGIARGESDLATLGDEVRALGRTFRAIPLDLRDARATAERLRGVEADILVHDAGVGIMKPLAELAEDEWATMIDVNVNALYRVTRPLLPGMLERRRGHLVLIGSISGRSALANGACYAATKAFVMSFAESLLLEVRDRGVKVSVVMPGSVDTDFSGHRGAGASWKLRADDVADAVSRVIDTPPAVLVHRLEIRTLTPPARG